MKKNKKDCEGVELRGWKRKKEVLYIHKYIVYIL